MAYLYETHMHTCQGSACGASTGAAHARAYKELGYTGIIVTDHFFRGNTAVPRDLPWEQRINLFCAGYEDAYQEGQRIGLDVFFGWEQNFNGDEYLIYGLDKSWLLAHPEMEHWTRQQQFDEVHKYGGCVIQAHPFRDRGYIAAIRLGKQFCDGIEVSNAGNAAYNDAAALRYGKEFGFVMTSGSDNHNADNALKYPQGVTGVSLDKKLTSIHDWVDIIRTRQPIGLCVPDSRFDIRKDAPHLDTYWMDENEELVPTGRDWLHEEVSPMTITLQPYHDQRETMLHLIQEFWHEHNGDNVFLEDAAEDLAVWTAPGHLLYLIEKSSIPVGFVHLGSRGVAIDWLEDIFVLPKHQRQGIGTQAVHLAEAIVQEYSDSLYIEAAARNQQAIRLYHRLGYTCLNTVSLRKDFQPEKYVTVHTESLYGHPLEIKQYK